MIPSSRAPQSERILRVLARQEVRYIVIGGIAAALQGSPYPTYDLDICPDSKTDNLDALAEALRKLEALEWDPNKDELLEREWNVETLQVDTTWLLMTKFGPLDLLMWPSATAGYPDLKRRSKVLDVAGVQVRVAHVEDLIRMKESSGRERDLMQIPTLRKLLDRVWNQDGAD